MRFQEESDSDKKKIMQLQKQVMHDMRPCMFDCKTYFEQLRANDENRAANQATMAEKDKGGMFDGVAKIGRIAMRAFVNGSE